MILYPRFSAADAQKVLEDVRTDVEAGRPPRTISPLGEHPLRQSGSVGGHPATDEQIQALDRAVRDAVPPGSAAADRNWGATFDREVSRALYEHLGDFLGATAQSGVWSFLSLVVFPDLVLERFPARKGLSAERFLEGRRNTFSRLHQRRAIFGDLMDREDVHILEDDFVGLVDRDISSDHRLAAALIRRAVRPPAGVDRRAFARELYKEALFEVKGTELRALDDETLESVVADLADRVRQRIKPS